MTSKIFKFFIPSNKKKIRYQLINEEKDLFIIFFHGFMSDIEGKKPSTFRKFCRNKKIGFLTFRDGFTLLQCIVAKNDIGEENFESFKSLTQESSIIISGKVVENEPAPGGFELLLTNINLLQLSKDCPISP